MLRLPRLLVLGTLLVAGAAFSPPVLADTSVAAGYFAPTPDSNKSLGLMGTTGLTLPIVPIAPQVTVALPFSGGRYAVTGEARVGHQSAYVGAGAGFGRMNSSGSTGGIYDVFAGKQIAPLTTIEARFYGLGSARAGSSGFIGVRFSI